MQDKSRGRNNKRNYRDKRNNDRKDRNQSREDRKDSRDEVRESGRVNDASYYFLDETLKVQMANVSFNQFAGVQVDLGPNTISKTGRFTDKPAYFMNILLAPSAGYTDAATISGLNLAALANYNNLSANNAKTSIYAPQDVIMLYLAMGQLIATVNHFTRYFGLMNLYNYRNRSFPREIVQGLGLDYDDFAANLANYRVQFNTLIVAMSKIPIPANVPYFMKCAELYSGLYMDMEGSPMAQIYAFSPASTWTINEAYNDNGTGLETTNLVPINGTTQKFEYYLMLLESMVNRMLTSSTFNAIYSDILRLADKEGLQLLHFTTVDENYTVVPAYVPEIRVWINNLVCMNGLPNGTSTTPGHTVANDVESDSNINGVKYRPYWSALQFTYDLDAYINFDYANPSADDIIYASRLIPKLSINRSATTPEIMTGAFPDHYPVMVIMYKAGGTFTRFASLGDGVPSNVPIMVDLSKFDWHPAMYLANAADGYIGTISDLNFYTTLDFKYLKALQDATYQGLFQMR